MSETLILGCGHPDRGDDAAGLAAVRRLGGTPVYDPTDLVHIWQKRDVILIDAVVTGSPAGTVHCWNGLSTAFAPGTLRVSTHSFGVAEAIEVSHALGRLPHSLTIYGIEGAEFAPGAGLTPAVAAGIDEVVRRIRAPG